MVPLTALAVMKSPPRVGRWNVEPVEPGRLRRTRGRDAQGVQGSHLEGQRHSASAIHFIVLAPMNKLVERQVRGADPATKQCPECPSEIPRAARKCAFSGSEQHDAAPG